MASGDSGHPLLGAVRLPPPQPPPHLLPSSSLPQPSLLSQHFTLLLPFQMSKSWPGPLCGCIMEPATASVQGSPCKGGQRWAHSQGQFTYPLGIQRWCRNLDSVRISGSTTSPRAKSAGRRLFILCSFPANRTVTELVGCSGSSGDCSPDLGSGPF